MKHIDNFEKISNLISGKSQKGDFYYLQILKRKKDNPELEKNMLTIDIFYIENEEHLSKLKLRIIDTCIKNNARAYFNLNKRNEKKIALQTLRMIADSIASEQYNIRNCYQSACGRFSSDPEKKWIIDVDTKDESTIQHIKYCISLCQPKNQIIYDIINTKNGVHIITSPFNVQDFRKNYKEELGIHKNNPTVLYIP